MNRTILVIIMACFLIVNTSCSLRHDHMIKKIAELEKEVKNTHPADTTQTKELISAYQNFASKFPKDSLAPEYLFRAAGLALNSNRTLQALEIYKSVVAGYPSSVKAPISLFMEAFVYENYLRDFGKANQMYNEFIAKYPTHEFVEDAQNALKYMGRSPEDMINDFESRNGEDSLNQIVH